MDRKKMAISFVIIGTAIIVVVLLIFLQQNIDNLKPKPVTEKNKVGEIEFVKSKIGEYNNKIVNSDDFQYLIDAKIVYHEDGKVTYHSGEFTDKEMLLFLSTYLRDNKKVEFSKNATLIDGEAIYAISYDFLNDYAKKIFGKELDKNALASFIDGNNIIFGIPTSPSAGIFKVKELTYDFTDNSYTLKIEQVKYKPSLIDGKVTEYASSDILNQFLIRFKKGSEVNQLISIECESYTSPDFY